MNREAIAIGNRYASGDGAGRASPTSGLFLLFAKGKRPSRLDVLRHLAALPQIMVSHDPGKRPTGSRLDSSARLTERESDDWLELLADGLTFDLLGLAPGAALAPPDIAYRFACPAHFDVDEVEAVGLLPGPHIVDGAHTLPVFRTLLGLGADLAGLMPGISAICWTPARSAMGQPYFHRIVENWLGGGTFPALGLASVASQEGGSLRSDGLAFFIGQEIELSRALSADRVAATRLAARLVHELVGMGRVTHPLEMTVEGAGRLLLDPRAGDALIRVTAV